MKNNNINPGLNPQSRMIVFQEKNIRRIWYNNEWWFAIVDVVAALTDSKQPEGYVKDLRRRNEELKGWGQIAPTPFKLKLKAVCKR